MANSIEHGHRDRPGGTVSLRASARSDGVHLTVADTGDWKVPQPGIDISRGRGVALMHDVTISPDASGTTVHMFSRTDR